MRSMTGFGKGQANGNGINVTVEISSVNRKQLDLRFNMPAELKTFEPEFRKTLSEQISRGSVNIKFAVDYDPALKLESVVINREVAARYMNEFNSMASELGIEGSITISDLIALPEVVVEKETDLDPEPFRNCCVDALKQALVKFVDMRAAEGVELKEDLIKRRRLLETIVDEIEDRTPLVVVEYQQKLKERVEKLLQEMRLDEESLAREVAYFADRCDISEEMTRLHSHFVQLDKLVEEDKPVGRALDFLVQEMFREINTTGSKANDAEISKRVVRFKTELEKVREQVQNME